MIIKSLSRRARGIGQLFRYLFRQEKVTRNTPRKLEHLLSTAMTTDKAVYIAGIRLSEKDVKYLWSEIQDAKLLSDMKAFKGTVQEFIQQRLIGMRPEIHKESKPFVITHNIRGRSLNSYIHEFEQLDARRMRQSANQTAVNHVILSWANTDAEKITDAMLRKVAQEYIRLRGENNLYVIVKHADVSHTHLHVTVSGTQLNGLSSRISQKEFADIKLAMDEFQKTHFPFLVNSLPNHGGAERGGIARVGSEKIKNADRLLDRNILLGLLETLYAKSTSLEQFLSEIRANGHEPYFRNGRLQGVLFEGERKFRLTPLGYDTEKLQALDLQKKKEEKTLDELQAIRARGGRETVRKLNESLKDVASVDDTIKDMESASLEIAAIRSRKNGREPEQTLEDSGRDFLENAENALQEAEQNNASEVGVETALELDNDENSTIFWDLADDGGDEEYEFQPENNGKV